MRTARVLAVLGLAVIVASAIHGALDPGAQLDTLRFARRPVVLAEGATYVVSFEARSGHHLGHEILLELDEGAVRAAWPDWAGSSAALPDASWRLPWRLLRDGHEVGAGARGPRRIERGIPFGDDVPYVPIGFPRPGYRGAHELRVSVEGLPAGLAGSAATIVVQAEMTRLKAASGAAGVRRFARLLAYVAGAFILLLALWAWGVAGPPTR